MTNETTPDAVERQYQDIDGNPCDLVTLCRRDPEWAANRITTLLAERARHAEEVAEMRAWGEAKFAGAQHEIEHLRDQLRTVVHNVVHVAVDQHEIEHLRDQLRRVEGERDAERKHATEMEGRALDLVRDLRLAQVELTSLRSLLPDVRACAEYIVERGVDNADGSARRILAALDSQGGEGE